MAELCNRREEKRHLTALRLQQCAVRLTLEHGFDGWTIDDLAAAADVSRRTVFNYFDGKAEVVLGPEPAVDEELVATFVGGGPTGRLFDDLIVLAHETTRDQAGSEQHMAAVRDAVTRGSSSWCTGASSPPPTCWASASANARAPTSRTRRCA
ncbi:TetR family transcriptional regulator [Nocardioides daeguensis]|uniref:HTH tetR-type domain-containing protein n=1 Tax=Nocardioides daeguensis TaxID=908359 RepID=A0ABP6VKF7_9ACTN|nr:TetR family transcriptional regulator [Nocardioides daeguensis]MBV6728969.1 TetR/AcrR family transcriptional regulator [Nocardioides daeguensis]MCR1773490.1 TetR/AcrR family transcriptional regulator [Nocardioides daeguensis]